MKIRFVTAASLPDLVNHIERVDEGPRKLPHMFGPSTPPDGPQIRNIFEVKSAI